MNDSQFQEIEYTYVDENDVLHLDGYKMNVDEGQTVAYVFNKTVYYTNPEFRYDSLVKNTIEELKSLDLVS